MNSALLKGFSDPQQRITLILIAVWTLTWKGLALWRSARKGKRNWFIALLILNTVGLLEIIYLVFFNNRGEKAEKSSEKKRNKK